MKTVLQSTLYAVGVFVILVALAHILLGQTWIPGTIPVNATLDSQHRFYAAIFLFVGIAIVWVARDPITRSAPIKFLCLAFFVAGLTRFLSIQIMGLPHPFIIGLHVIELVLPPIIIGMLTKIPCADSDSNHVELQVGAKNH